MFPFWDLVIGPLLETAGTRRLVEIGALRGDNTRRIISRLGPDAELHVVDPAPGFDPEEHEREFAGQYVFHRALSVDVLGELPPMDAALVDGDHNWYTVVNELRLLEQVTEAHRRPLPILVLHDVGWPYGRRDLYYDPDSIPAEHRQPHRRAGMRPGRRELVSQGGMSAGHWNAEVEGGPRNGVMTALEDFLGERRRSYRLVVFPLYFGLAVVVDRAWLKARPALGALLDRFESPAFKDELIALGEDLRLRSVAHNHTLLGERQAHIERLAGRYVDGVVAAVLNELRPEAELNLHRLLETGAAGAVADTTPMLDPARRATVAFDRLADRTRRGWPDGLDSPVGDLSFSPIGRLGLEALIATLAAVRERAVPGDVLVLGCGRGGTTAVAKADLDAHDEHRTVWVADRFAVDGPGSLNRVRELLHRLGLLDDQVRLLQGDPAATLAGAGDRFALVVVGAGTDPDDVRAGLAHALPRLAAGGEVVVEHLDDHVAAELDRLVGPDLPLRERFGSTGIRWRPDATTPPVGAPTSAAGASRSPLAASVTEPIDLSVVVVVHDMAREARRTLESLSRSYQRGVEGLDYEVLVVDNGSAPAQRLGPEAVAGFGPEFRLVDMGADAPPSPVAALNRGIAEARGEHLGLMIDGAHVLTPGVLRYAMTGLTAYGPAVVATQPWYLGPGQQGEAMRHGYDQTVEDALLRKVDWPTDGYRLFEIGHFVGDRDWLEGLWESNCLFTSRKLLEQVGGFDEAFAMPGGGYANLDLYERLASSPTVELVTIMGEGSFHQVHGGTTTNLPDPVERRTTVQSYADHYRQLRGRPFGGPERPLRLVGSFQTNESKRTRARRMTGTAFDVERELEGLDGPLGPAVPVPDDVRDGFVRAYWHGQAWRRTSWVGHPLRSAPTDLVTYQEVVAEVRPDWIIDVGGRDGGRAFFLATVCELLGHGRVVAVSREVDDGAPDHARLTRVTGHPAHSAEALAEVRDRTGPAPRGLVLLGSRGGRDRVLAEFAAYAPLVAVGSYAMIEHTMLNGWPVDASFGRGPFEAVRTILATRDDFVVDTEREKHSLTFNPNGYLRRIM